MRRLLFVLFAALLVAVPATAQRNVRRVFAGIETSSGRPVVDIAASELHVTENGVERPVVRAALATGPMRIILMVDASGPAAKLVPEFRLGMQAFVDALPPEHEIVLLSVSGQMRVRAPATTDRTRLRTAIANFSSDGGGVALIDGILEADRRFLQGVSDRWPVFVLLTADAINAGDSVPAFAFDAFLHNFAVRAGSAHAIVVAGAPTRGINSEVARFLTMTGHGLFERLAIANSLSERMKLIAARLTSDHQAMAERYELDYESASKTDDISLEVSVDRKDAIVIVSSRRPFFSR